jgi:ribosomal protein L11 methyltransferase
LRSLTVSVRPQDVEALLDRLLLVAPRGVHELQGERSVELLLYGEAGELAEAEAVAAREPLVRRLVSADAPGDWRDRRAATHRSQPIGERLVVRPSWAPRCADSPPRVEVVLEAGVAFGTGAHPTTRGCLEAVEALAPGASLADLGCGSGVVAVAAALLGWGRVVAVDVNPASVEATRANAVLNAVEVEALVLDLAEEPPPAAQMLVANVPLSVHGAIAPHLAATPPQSLIASGVPADEIDQLVDTYAGPSLAVVSRRVVDGWAVVVLGKDG